MISKDRPLILASNSPRRKRLLHQVGLPFHVFPSQAEEEQGGAGEYGKSPSLLAESKARAVWPRWKNHWILGADTVVVLETMVLGKPADPEDAREMLSRLSGREHEVITGFCLLDPSGRQVHREDVATVVKMRPLSEREIEAYVRTSEPFGKAGGYAIQGIGAFMVESISGSFTNVVGLPLCALIKALLQAGALESFPLEKSSTL